MDREIKSNVRRRQALKGGLRVILIPGLIFAAVIWLTGMLKPELKRARIRTARVERGVLEAVITAAGTVQPAREQVISSPIEARVIRVLEQPGAHLAAGDAVVELDVSQSRLELAGLEGRIERAENRRRELELELQESLIELTSRRRLKGLDVEQLNYEVEQNRQLYDQGLISEAALRQVETRLEKAKIEHTTFDASIANSKKSMAAQIRSLDSEFEDLVGERDEAQRTLERATTQAERSGVLTWVVEEEGMTVRAGDVLAKIADLDSFRVEATVSDIHAARLQPGLPVRLPLGASVLTGRISRVLPAVESGAARFWVELDEPDHEHLRAHLRLDVLVVTERRDDVLRLKKGPFANGPGALDVLVVDGAVAQRRAARLGLSGHEHWEVIEGLAEGDEVVVSDTSAVIHLEEVEIR